MQWNIRASLSASGQLAYCILDESGNETNADLLGATPVDLLVAAAAGCFVKSAHMVLAARREESVAVTADLHAVKASGTPARVEKIRISYAMPALAPEMAARIAKDAKRICTVTNSMSCEFELVD